MEERTRHCLLCIIQAAQILTDSLPNGWPTLQDALVEIDERLVPVNTLLAAMEDDIVIGWGGILAPTYDGNVFELHPLAIRNDKRNHGVGRAIVTALEDEARKQGGLTIYLGADDEKGDGETSLVNVDLYDDLPEKIKNFNPGTHQSGFYLKLGYKIIGVMPDVNRIGKPDIYSPGLALVLHVFTPSTFTDFPKLYYLEVYFSIVITVL